LGIVKPKKELDLRANIEVCRIFAFDETTDPFWKDFLTPALGRGTLKYLPEPRVVGSGLEWLQEASDTLDKGVSATKLVVQLSWKVCCSRHVLPTQVSTVYQYS
jgi:hypothetical protein